jgi:hypothetical protein
MPFLGEVCYASFCGFDVPIAITKANLTIGHDETPGDQSTPYDSDLQNNPGPDQQTDDVDGRLGNILTWKADWTSSTTSPVARPAAKMLISAISRTSFRSSRTNSCNNGNFCADPLGVAKTYLTVSFGADGKAKGNDQAGNTLFNQDNDAGEGTDNSQKSYDSNGNLIGNDDGGTDKQAFELFMKNTNSESEGERRPQQVGHQLDHHGHGEWRAGDHHRLCLPARRQHHHRHGLAEQFRRRPEGQESFAAMQGARACGNDIAASTGEGDAHPRVHAAPRPGIGPAGVRAVSPDQQPAEGGNAASPDWDQTRPTIRSTSMMPTATRWCSSRRPISTATPLPRSSRFRSSTTRRTPRTITSISMKRMPAPAATTPSAATWCSASATMT